MNRFFLLLSTVIICAGLLTSGCTRKPSPDEINKLQEQRSAAESAEKKLSELRDERAKLEAQLEAKKTELKKAEEERDAVADKADDQPDIDAVAAPD